MTKYGKKILNIINASCEHMTAEQIFLALKKTEPKVVLATVYNNLKTLCDTQMIRKISIEGSVDRYDKMEKHDHLICRKCGRVTDIVFEDLTKKLEEQLGESILSYDLRISYLCPACKNKSKQEE